MLKFRYTPEPVLRPQPDCPWAATMVLNPAMVADPQDARLHMLFRACGPCADNRRPGRAVPYPISLGYAFSDNAGHTWTVDFSRAALAPALHDNADSMYIRNIAGGRAVNHANGAIEDPRLFWLDGELLLTVACRMFPPGDYWRHVDLTGSAPPWTRRPDQPFGRAASENVTVSVLYRVNLAALRERDYQRAFDYVTALTDPAKGDNRDVFLFPQRLQVNDRPQYACVHRPSEPAAYSRANTPTRPSIYLSTAASLDELACTTNQHVLAKPTFEWEADRIGGSWPPIPLGENEWLLGYHGKQDNRVGYTQSFMIVRVTGDGTPVVLHRCSQRLMFAQQEWELNGCFKTPCLFTCAGVRVGEELVMSYGAADTYVGIARVNFAELVAHIRRCPSPAA